MSTDAMSCLLLAGSLLLAGPLSAQDAAEPAHKMIVAVWPDTSAASNTIRHMSKSAKDQIAAYGVLVKLKDGTVETRQRYHNPRGPGAGVQSSELVDRATARLSQPAGAADSASGYESGGQPSQLSPEDLKKVQDMFGPNESALVLLSTTPDVSQIKRTLGVGAQSSVEVVEIQVKE
jgi:hypothetical protein